MEIRQYNVVSEDAAGPWWLNYKPNIDIVIISKVPTVGHDSEVFAS